MCGRMTQFQVTARYRDRAKLAVTYLSGQKLQVEWNGFVRDDRPELKAQMERVTVSGITFLGEHHGQEISFKGPKELVGWVRKVGKDGHLALFVETEDRIVNGKKDRWPKPLKESDDYGEKAPFKPDKKRY